MREGFFSVSEVATNTPSTGTVKCGVCQLYKGCSSPKMAYTGLGKEKVLVVGEAPGEQEDEEGVQLIGRAGQHLRRSLDRLDISLDLDCWKTNAIICHPPKNKTPTDKQIEACRPCLLKTIDELQPEKIILLGGIAVKSLIQELWGDSDIGGIGRWVGWQIPSQKLNAWVCPNYHPSYLMRQKNQPTLQLWFDRYLKTAFNLSGRPWKTVPNYQEQIECIYSADDAATVIRKMIERGGRVSFDYESNMLKPDRKNSRIVCCSVCWEGKKTISFPWYGEAIVAMGELLQSDLHKIGWNQKHEQRWTKKEFGFGVRNWLYDGMLGSHVLDNRKGITSAKFQAFTLLGQELYNKEVEALLKGDGGNNENLIRMIDLPTLLLYCGMDSLLEFVMGEKQMKLLGMYK